VKVKVVIQCAGRKVVIQRAGRKDRSPGSLRTSDGRRVYFVAHPGEAEEREGQFCARPDDLSEDGRTWRERLLSYNASPGANRLELLPAYRLYRNDVYRSLEGEERLDLFILSAGWGLIPATFLTPDYNITFSKNPKISPAFRRHRSDVFHDWSMIDGGSSEPLVFLGGKDYLPHFVRLTDQYQGPRIVVFNSITKPSHEGLTFVRYKTRTRTNWHYKAAKALLDGTLRLPGIHGGL